MSVTQPGYHEWDTSAWLLEAYSWRHMASLPVCIRFSYGIITALFACDLQNTSSEMGSYIQRSGTWSFVVIGVRCSQDQIGTRTE